MDETLMKLRGRTFAAQFNRTGNIHGCSLAHGKQTVAMKDVLHHTHMLEFPAETH